MPTEAKVKINAHTDACTCLAINPTGDTLATGGDDKCLKLWNTKKMNEIAVLRVKNHVICAIAFSLDNEYLM